MSGWLRCEQFGAGMITGWGTHHFDHTGQWEQNLQVLSKLRPLPDFLNRDYGTRHGDFNVKAKYSNGVIMHISGEYPNGLKFIGTEGWIFVARSDSGVTTSDPRFAGQSPGSTGLKQHQNTRIGGSERDRRKSSAFRRTVSLTGWIDAKIQENSQ